MTLLAVIGSLVASLVMFGKGTLQIINGVYIFFHELTVFSLGVEHSSDILVATLVSSVDNYLFATVLIIFSMGLYEFFISKIDPISRTEESRPNWLKVSSLDDDLKSSLGKVILMILVVAFFEYSLSIEYKEAIDLLWLGVGIVLVSAALYLTHAGSKRDH